MEMASRPCGLKFGRFIFEFGISGSAGSVHGSKGTAVPRLERYYRASGTAAVGSRYYRYMPCSIIFYRVLILVALFGGLCSFFRVVSSAHVFGSK
mgnify:CR=1 FL=1